MSIYKLANETKYWTTKTMQIWNSKLQTQTTIGKLEYTNH